jgi:hypothetical protein
MLSKEEYRLLNISFWTGFKDHMKKIHSSNGRRMNWLNYPSDVKGIYIRLEADGNGARLCLDIQPKDDGIRAIIWEQMCELKRVLESTMTINTNWEENHILPDGRTISRIYWSTADGNFYQKDDHDKLYHFLKSGLIEFDLFYQEFKDILILLVN